jgi:hypothetical protein
VVQVDETTRVSISVGGGQDTSAAQSQSLLICQVVSVLGVQHTIGKGLTGTNTEQVAGKSRAVAVNVVQGGTLLLGHSGTHGTHRQTHALVLVDQVGENLGGSGHGDAALVSELVKAALHSEPCEPVLTICGTTSHSSQHLIVDLNHLLDGLRGNPVAGRGSRICGDDDAALEAEGEGGGTMGNLDGALRVGTVVGCCSEPCRGL